MYSFSVDGHAAALNIHVLRTACILGTSHRTIRAGRNREAIHESGHTNLAIGPWTSVTRRA
jgi:hypothetical protein